MTPQERLFRLTSPEPNSGCWLWMGSYTRSHRNKRQYGHFNLGGKIKRAHRVAYELWRGPIPPGFTVDHLCRTPECVNPGHLEAVTNQENCRRGDNTILTRDLAAAVYMDGRRNREIAVAFGIATRTVEAIKSGDLWPDATGHLGPPPRRKTGVWYMRQLQINR